MDTLAIVIYIPSSPLVRMGMAKSIDNAIKADEATNGKPATGLYLAWAEGMRNIREALMRGI